MTFWFSVFLFSVSFFISVSWRVYFCCFRQLQSCTFEFLFTFRTTKHTCRTDKLYILPAMFKIQLECPLDWCVSGTLFIDFWLSLYDKICLCNPPRWDVAAYIPHITSCRLSVVSQTHANTHSSTNHIHYISIQTSPLWTIKAIPSKLPVGSSTIFSMSNWRPAVNFLKSFNHREVIFGDYFFSLRKSIP